MYFNSSVSSLVNDISCFMGNETIVGRSRGEDSSELRSSRTLIPWSLPMMYDVSGKTLGDDIDRKFVGVVLISDRFPDDPEP